MRSELCGLASRRAVLMCSTAMSRVTCGMPRNDARRIPGEQRGAIPSDETSGRVCPGMRNPLDPARFAGWWGCSVGLRMSGHAWRDGCWSVVLSGGMIRLVLYVLGCAIRWILPDLLVGWNVLPGCVCMGIRGWLDVGWCCGWWGVLPGCVCVGMRSSLDSAWPAG